MADPVGFLQEDNGNKSAMRLMCLMAMGAAILFGALVVFRGDPSGNGLYISAMFLAGALGGKIGQKTLEQPGSTTPVAGGESARPEGAGSFHPLQP